jgi:hypothetical protein
MPLGFHCLHDADHGVNREEDLVEYAFRATVGASDQLCVLTATAT